MGKQANTTEIAGFLGRMKGLVSAGNYDFVPRRKCLQSLAKHGLSIRDAKAEVLELVVADYYKGPKMDLDVNRPGDIWEFKKTVDGIKFYIKLKIVCENGKDIVKCIGFHEDDFP